jgi:uncharacterized membrane protein YraQ (UPF0718 family)/copper chaperone CopZ
MLGFLFAGLLHSLVPKDKIVHYLGAQNFRSVINAALLGIPLPLCSCGVVPTGLSFYKNGASKGSSISFLISTPQTGIDSMMITYSMLGLPFAIFRPLIALITGIFGGWVTNKATHSEFQKHEERITESFDTRKPKNKIFEIFKYGFVDFLQDIAKWLVIGLFIAALISVLIPEHFFEQYRGNELFNMLIAIAIAGPLYVCATGSVPIAAALMMKGLSPGAALVFLMVGPATNAATVTMVGKVLGRKTLFAYLGTVLISALFFGFIMNEVMPQQWFGMGNMNHAAHNHQDMMPKWLMVTSSIALTLAIINAFRLKYWPSHKTSENMTSTLNNMETKTVAVLGMTCNHCKMNVENNLRKLPGIKDITVDLQHGQAIIIADKINLDLVKSTVEGLGYKYGGEK